MCEKTSLCCRCFFRRYLLTEWKWVFFYLLNCLINTLHIGNIIIKVTRFIIEKILVPKEIFLSGMKLAWSNLGFITYNLTKGYEADFQSLKMCHIEWSTTFPMFLFFVLYGSSEVPLLACGWHCRILIVPISGTICFSEVSDLF